MCVSYGYIQLFVPNGCVCVCMSFSQGKSPRMPWKLKGINGSSESSVLMLNSSKCRLLWWGWSPTTWWAKGIHPRNSTLHSCYSVMESFVFRLLFSQGKILYCGWSLVNLRSFLFGSEFGIWLSRLWMPILLGCFLLVVMPLFTCSL